MVELKFLRPLKSWMGIWVLAHLCPLEAAVQVEAFVDTGQSATHAPVKGTITVTHAPQEKVDGHSFELEGKPLVVQLIGSRGVADATDTMVTIYAFVLPPQEKGLHVLPALSVQINGQRYRSVPSAYRIGEEVKPTPPAGTAASDPLIFRLEAAVKGPTTLYPGERTVLFYRILYNRNVDLTRSILPMIHPDHFQKIGDVRIEDHQTASATIQELTQEVQAAELGHFRLGPSLIEGYAYHNLPDGRKVYEAALLKSEASPVELEVKPFPLLNQPPSFHGALGRIEVEATLDSPAALAVGEEAKVRLTVRGVADLAAFELPFLPCQPGFAGFFQMDDFPPLTALEGATKTFHTEIRVLTPLATQIPAMQFSSFDPPTGQYVVRTTEPIPLKIKSSDVTERYSSAPNLNGGFWRMAAVGAWPSPVPPPLMLTAPPVRVTADAAPWSWVGWWLLGMGGWLVQQKYRRRRRAALPSQPKTSQVLLAQALQPGFFPSAASLQCLETAFWQLLWERGALPSGSRRLEALQPSEWSSPIRAFLLELQALQYGAYPSFEAEQLKRAAQTLFDQHR